MEDQGLDTTAYERGWGVYLHRGKTAQDIAKSLHQVMLQCTTDQLKNIKLIVVAGGGNDWVRVNTNNASPTAIQTSINLIFDELVQFENIGISTICWIPARLADVDETTRRLMVDLFQREAKRYGIRCLGLEDAGHTIPFMENEHLARDKIHVTQQWFRYALHHVLSIFHMDVAIRDRYCSLSEPLLFPKRCWKCGEG